MITTNGALCDDSGTVEWAGKWGGVRGGERGGCARHRYFELGVTIDATWVAERWRVNKSVLLGRWSRSFLASSIAPLARSLLHPSIATINASIAPQ